MAELNSKKPEESKLIPPNCCSTREQKLDFNPGNNAKMPDWVIGRIKSKIGEIPAVSTSISLLDRLGGWKVRWGIGRNSYRIMPGLYAVGNPSESSPVFVSANYKLSFDRLRSQLDGIDGWIMVLDTKGINVWCAAGKGTFGTEEIINRVDCTRLAEVVSQRRLIVPQLGAPGIAAHEVKDRCGFRIVYGPVRANDIRDFIRAGYKATPQMRKVKFSTWNRAVLIPNDLIVSFKYALFAAVVLFVLSGFGSGIFSIDRMITKGTVISLLIIFAYMVSSILPPLLLPLLPGKSFSIKGIWVGLLAFLLLLWYSGSLPGLISNNFSLYAWLFIFPAISSFITMNFTGSSTYTSLSGVLKEMKIAVPMQAGTAVIGLILLIIGIFI